MSLPRVALPLVAALLGVGLATPSARAADPQVTAVLTLAADTASLHQLAARHPNRAALHALAPATSHRDAVLRFARRTHLRVVRADAWSVTVAGSRTELTQALRTAPTDVASVVGLDSRRLHRSHAIRHATSDGQPNPQTGATLRAQYDVPTGWRGAGVTVAILNLAGWRSSDLQAFAPNVLPPGQITEVPVGADPAQLDGFGSEFEVALDAEAVLSAAPEAKQRLYFVPNTMGGVVSGLEQIAADAEQGLVQVVSTSWGSCERDFDQSASDADRAAYTAAIDRLLVAGATLFAASGDAGAFDCGFAGSPDGEAQVDFPASYQNTVAVGGTTLTSGQPETGWHDRGFGAYLGDGSGGGESIERPLPAYQLNAQRRLVPDLAADADPESGLRVYASGWTTAGGTSLSAPLLAGMLAAALSSQPGHPGLGNILPSLYASAHGLTDVVSGHNGLFTAHPGYDQVTGLGTPDWAVLGADLLASSAGAPATGTPSLVVRPARSGDPILPDSYTRTLTAPVSVRLPDGATYAGFDLGEDLPACAAVQPLVPTSVQLPVDAGQGPHRVTLTAFDSAHVCHLVTATVVYDTVSPTATISAELVNLQTTQVRLHLGGTDATSGIASYAVEARDAAGAVVLSSVTTSHTPVVSVFRAGQTYTVRATPQDRAGNTGDPATLVVTFARDDPAFARSAGWGRVRGPLDYQGTHLQSQQAGASATLTAAARRIDAYLQRGPSSGYVDAYVDGVRIARLNLYAASPSAFRPTLGRWATVGTHTVRLVVVGAHPRGSRGSDVVLDGVVVAG